MSFDSCFYNFCFFLMWVGPQWPKEGDSPPWTSRNKSWWISKWVVLIPSPFATAGFWVSEHHSAQWDIRRSLSWLLEKIFFPDKRQKLPKEKYIFLHAFRDSYLRICGLDLHQTFCNHEGQPRDLQWSQPEPSCRPAAKINQSSTTHSTR